MHRQKWRQVDVETEWNRLADAEVMTADDSGRRDHVAERPIRIFRSWRPQSRQEDKAETQAAEPPRKMEAVSDAEDEPKETVIEAPKRGRGHRRLAALSSDRTRPPKRRPTQRRRRERGACQARCGDGQPGGNGRRPGRGRGVAAELEAAAAAMSSPPASAT